MFQPGNKSVGRPKGSRSKLGSVFLQDLIDDWTANGAAAIRVVRMTDPVAYVRVVANILPKEMLVETVSLTDYGDDALDAMIELMERIERQEVLLVEAKPA